MSIPFLSSIDLNKNEIQNTVLHRLATAPATPTEAQLYYNTVDKAAYVYDSTGWRNLCPTGAGIVTLINASTSLIDDDNLSSNANDAITKRHSQNTDTTLTGSTIMTINTTGAGNIVDFKVSSVVKASVDTNGKYTGTIDWANINNKPTGSVANIDLAISKMHDQNTDTGTTNTSFMIDSDNAAAGTDLKLLFNRGSTAVDASLMWDETADKFLLYATDATTLSRLDVLNINGYTIGHNTHTQNTDTTLTGSGIMTVNTTGAGNIVDFKVSSVVRASVDTTGKFTGTIDWANVNSKPSSSVANIDDAVSKRHTQHTDTGTTGTSFLINQGNVSAGVNTKLLFERGATATDASLLFDEGNDKFLLYLVDGSTLARLDVGTINGYTVGHSTHAQNTDTGTTSATFHIQSGSSGPKLKNSSGELQIRNSADNAFADLRVNNLYVEGTTTTINSNTVAIGDSEIELNSDVTASGQNSDGGITIKRLKADNVTRADAKLTFNNTTGRWQLDFGAVATPILAKEVAVKFTQQIGDGVATSYVLTHNLNTRTVKVSVRQVASPYAEIITDNEATTVNTVTVRFAQAPSTNQYEVTIIG